ncbi:lipoyl synthase [Alicyclobacillus mengziensis]|uniref:Lipoyl synthase n=1 Tax=Alicyclobacillus mengziensis TaxID=2931921 RepID=A0A9X7Z5S5_9BACL|nr:lipoyl synthase [Alicyclobacillus mengziensis]QSO45575.1 lipoyl synthase [Alicyclobacillus mengziensis]
MSERRTLLRSAERERIRQQQTASRPHWLKVSARPNEKYNEIKDIMRGRALHTVCEEAHCPNIFECWGKLGTATFMILGDVCTRNCRFCAVNSGRPSEVDLAEPARVADAVAAMNLRHVVITSVDRDDLQDGGASIFAASVEEIRKRVPTCGVEVLIPDFAGNWSALQCVMDASPDILDHNVETVRRLSDSVRSKATYNRSLELLQRAKQARPDIRTKSSIMVGIGESLEEISETFDDLWDVGVDIVTVGQYLQPTKQQVLVEKFYTPEEFNQIRIMGMKKGFKHIQAGPLVRTSYHAHDQVLRAAGLPLQSLDAEEKNRVLSTVTSLY